MRKRKFEEFRDQPRPNNNASPRESQRQERIDGQLHNSKTALFRALKIARGFERQKLGRRQKNAAAEKNLDDVRRLRLEVAELKGLDLAGVAEIHLYKSLLKVKPVASSDELPNWVHDAVQKARKKDESLESLNVQARLFKTEPVLKAMSEALSGITNLLGVQQGKTEAKKRLRAKDFSTGTELLASFADLPNSEGAQSPKHKEDEEQEWEGFSSPAHSQNSLRFEAEDDSFSSVDGDNYEQYAARLATSSTSESGSDRSTPLPLRSTSPPRLHRFSESIESDDLTSNPPSQTRVASTVTKKSKLNGLPSSSATKTTFLPSLLTSGYYSGDSDASSLDHDLDDRGNDRGEHSRQPQRKNRMGQQARRALWEKKFKDRANHLHTNGGVPEDGSSTTIRGDKAKNINDNKNNKVRDQGWDAKRGARSDAHVRGKGRAQRREGGRRGQGATGANGENTGVRTKGSGGGSVQKAKGQKKSHERSIASSSEVTPLHPSWEAAKRVKEARLRVQQSNGKPPMGRKVVFD